MSILLFGEFVILGYQCKQCRSRLFKVSSSVLACDFCSFIVMKYSSSWPILVMVFFSLQGAFDVCRKVFVGGDETANMTLTDKIDLFFNDYSIIPLFVQENYLSVTPYSTRYIVIICNWTTSNKLFHNSMKNRMSLSNARSMFVALNFHLSFQALSEQSTVSYN